MFSIAIVVFIVTTLLLTMGSACVFKGQEFLEVEDLSDEGPFVIRSLKNIDMMIEGCYYCLLSFEFIKKGEDIEGSVSVDPEHFDRLLEGRYSEDRS